jgi:hypothetical protein
LSRWKNLFAIQWVSCHKISYKKPCNIIVNNFWCSAQLIENHFSLFKAFI